jgi:hypothetical protein
MYLKILLSYHVDSFDTHVNFKDFVTAALQLFSKFNCKELLLVKYVNAKDIAAWKAAKT